ncbi:kelch repeat and BTB domain-containing protein 3-like isoform X2 [Macrosteles quadrilineatus]|uniref:kelch repeat and BTB domain-containing protein 3-like isoform X2 n=1 Tax=Macrosteles quadrilineatus TaxID=74068 RepID=UPI0023E0D8E7|nr:kelch repeat and BTB domain-containing protein 3-like isoform X2 [Macrosteles quadrilineatus]
MFRQQLGVDPEALDFILKTLNGNEVDFTRASNVLHILETTCMLQFGRLQNECIQFIVCSWLNKETWLITANLADKLGLTDLKKKTQTLALWNFSEVRKTEHFLYLTADEVFDYLSDDRLRTTVGEFEVFEAGVNWIEYSPEDRLFFSLLLLRTVRFKDLKPFDIRNMLHYSSVKDTPQAEIIIQCILEMKDGLLNQSCEACNTPEFEEQSTTDSEKTSPMPTAIFFKNLKRKRRTTSHCTCFDDTTVKTCHEFLDKEPRCLPLIPCVAASFPFKSTTPDESPRLKLRRKNKWPYIFHWDGENLVPFIHLSKIDEGPAEAMGYKVSVKDLKLYVIGGEYMMGHGDWNTSVWSYDTWRETWEFETSLPSPRRHHSAVFVNNDLFVIGGVGRHRVMLDSVAKYNLVSKCWETCAPLPTTLYSAPCCVYREDIYLFGPQIYCYRQAICSWESVARISLPDNMAVATAMSDNTLIYIIGITAKLYCFDPQTEDVKVKFLGEFKTPGNNACLVNKTIYSFGEEDGVQSVEEYSIKKRTFTTLWHHKRADEDEPSVFCLNQAAGCFSFPKYY